MYSNYSDQIGNNMELVAVKEQTSSSTKDIYMRCVKRRNFATSAWSVKSV